MDPSSLPHTVSVCCVLVNWNGRDDTLHCLHSLATQTAPLTVVVVDNGSTDGSVAAIHAAYPGVHVLETGQNLGFAGGTNVGLRWAAARGADFVWLLNNDTEAPPETLARLLEKAASASDLGAVGTVLYRMNQPTVVQAWGGGRIRPSLAYSRHFYAPTLLGRGAYLTFASVLIPVPVLRRSGVLYEGFFMYFDDADLGLRLRRAGYRLAVAEDTAVLHKEGGSSVGLSPLMDQFATTSGLRFLRRHAIWPLGSMAAYLGLRLTNRLVKRRWKNLRSVLTGVRIYWQERHKNFSEIL